MVDIVDKITRSRMMAGIQGKDTKPELIIRKALFAKGLRYRLHDSRLPGKPDMVFPKYRAVIFVHGCFWHGHNCRLFKWPSNRDKFWKKKILGNKQRDHKQLDEILSRGWRVLTVWECSLKGLGRRDPSYVIGRLVFWLQSNRRNAVIEGKFYSSYKRKHR